MTEVAADDPNDDVVVEAAVAAAIAEALAHPPDLSRFTADQAEAIMEATVGTTLRFYAQRVLTRFLSELRAGEPVDSRDYVEMTTSLDAAIRRAIDDTGESVRDIIHANAQRAASRGLVIEEGLDTEARAYSRLREGMSGVGRILTTRTRELAKWEYATRLGAAGKKWHTKRDGRVRTSHADLEGDFVPMDQPFVTIKNNELMRPGDVNAPLEETIFCRCRLSYRMA